jgi:hypothetical protein
MFEQSMTKNKLRKIPKTYNYYKDDNASSFTKCFFNLLQSRPIRTEIAENKLTSTFFSKIGRQENLAAGT